MQRIFQLLKSRSFECYLVLPTRLLYDFNSFYVVIDIQSEEEYEDLIIPDNFGKNVIINQLSISYSEYLGWREDQITESISVKLANFLNFLFNIEEEIILDFYIDINEGYDETALYCSTEPNYIFNIDLDHKHKKIEYALRQVLNFNVEPVFPNKFYNGFIHQYRQLDKFKDLPKILTTNTKTRRLGYLKAMSDFFYEFRKISKTKINKKFENFAIKYQQELAIHSNTKGLIKESKTGISAKPYVNLAKDLDWISSVNNIQIPSKAMKVYNILQQQLVKTNKQIFSLTFFDKLFFIELLISKDYLYISIILELVYSNPHVKSYIDLRDGFQSRLIQRLNHYISQSYYQKTTKELKIIRDRVSKWEKAPIYLEHVLMPRLNWLNDLDILQFKQKSNFILTTTGKKLFYHFCFWQDINYSYILNPKEYIDRFIVHIFDDIYNFEHAIHAPDLSALKNKINEYLTESFLYFKTLAPNRVTASQALIFVKYKLYFIDGIMVGQKYIESYLRNDNNHSFIFKYQQQYNDGYIQKKRT